MVGMESHESEREHPGPREQLGTGALSDPIGPKWLIAGGAAALDSEVGFRVHTSGMDDCCCPPAAVRTSPRSCPACRANGAVVELQTVKALLTESALTRVEIAHHRFCANPACQVVYFDDEGRTFAASDVRVGIWQKEEPGARTICHCFGETERSMRAELETTGRIDAVQRVRAHIAARRCACDIRNPRGACCLGDLIATAQRLQAECALNGTM